MDGLALLCTLYGDGPVTLRRLREAGWDTVDRIESLDPNTLSQDVGLPFEQARRLQREARGLLERVGGFSEAPLPSMQDGGDVSPSTPVPLDPISAPREAPETDSDAAPEVDPARGVLIPHRPAPPAPLAANVLDGLDQAAIDALAGAGVTTLDELMGADELELTRTSGLPLTRLLRFRFLARRLESTREVESDGVGAAAAEADQRFSPSEYGSSGGRLEEPPIGGPFA